MSRVTTALIAIIIALLVGMWYTTSQMQSLRVGLKEITQVSNQQKADLENIQRQRVQAAELDIKVTQELANAKSEIELFVLALTLVLSGCASRPVVQSCPKPPPPPESLMQPAPNMMQSLNAIISVSSNESGNPKQ